MEANSSQFNEESVKSRPRFVLNSLQALWSQPVAASASTVFFRRHCNYSAQALEHRQWQAQ